MDYPIIETLGKAEPSLCNATEVTVQNRSFVTERDPTEPEPRLYRSGAPPTVPAETATLSHRGKSFSIP